MSRLSMGLWGLLALIALTAGAQAEVNWRVAARGGADFKEDAGFDIVTTAPVAGVSELSLGRRVVGPWWIGLAMGGSTMQGTTFQALDARWHHLSFRLTAMARWPLLEQIAVYGRLGPTLNRTALSLGQDEGDAELESVSWALGVIAGAGVEWTPLINKGATGEIDLAFGLSLEATYQRVVPADIELGDARVGSLDPSGPGFVLGVMLAW